MSSIPRLMELHRQVLLYSLHFVVCPRYRHFLSGLSRRLSPGTSVAVYGTIGPDSPRSSYLLDAPPASVYTAGTLQATAFQQLFFQSPTLSDGEHTLLVTNLGSGALWIDYFRYTSSVTSQPASPSASSSLTSSRIVTVTPSNESVINSPTPDPSPSGTGPGPNPARTPIPIAAVVGGAIGALVLIIALIFGMLYYRKRARRLAGVQLLEKKDVLAGKTMIQLSPMAQAQTSYVSLRFLRARQDRPWRCHYSLYEHAYAWSPFLSWSRGLLCEYVPPWLHTPAV
jgi:hypothetical protein